MGVAFSVPTNRGFDPTDSTGAMNRLTVVQKFVLSCVHCVCLNICVQYRCDSIFATVKQSIENTFVPDNHS